MKAIYKISCIFLIFFAIYFSIADSYITAYSFMAGKIFDFENTNHQKDNPLQNNLNFEDEEYSNDNIINVFSDYLFVSDYSVKISAFKALIPNSFLSVIWQPPKI